MSQLKNHIWIVVIPFLFLPNDLFPFGETGMGDIQFMDVVVLLLLPFWLPVFVRQKFKPQLSSVRESAYFFLGLITLLVAFLTVRFEFVSEEKYLFSLFKVFKFSLYVLFGLFLMDRFKTTDVEMYQKSVRVTILLVSGVLLANFFFGNIGSTNTDIDAGNVVFVSYSAQNVIAVALAILLATQIEVVLSRKSMALIGGFVVGFLALMLSGGRGGVVALIVAFLVYLFRNYSLETKVYVFLGFVMILGALYALVPEVQFQIDRTINPDEQFLEQHNMGVGGLDDGKRLSGFLRAFQQWFDRPVLGHGFFHRGGVSGLAEYGSHNFFLQMLLETGLIGFLLLLNFIRNIYRRIKVLSISWPKISSRVFYALLAAFISGFSGEYFYGGEALMALFVALMPLGLNENEEEVR